MSSPSLLKKGQIVSGPWHPAFGFLVRSGIYHRHIEPDLPVPGRTRTRHIRILAAQRDISLLRGYKNQRIEAIEVKTGATVDCVEGVDTVPQGRVRVVSI